MLPAVIASASPRAYLERSYVDSLGMGRAIGYHAASRSAGPLPRDYIVEDVVHFLFNV